MYIPNSIKDKIKLEKKFSDCNITTDELRAYVRKDKYNEYRTDDKFINVCEEIRKSFDRCITEDSDILQGCV